MKRKQLILLILSMVVVSYQTLAQNSEARNDTTEKEIFYRVDQLPEFPGGMSEFYAYVAKNLKYPVDARKAKVEGKVFVEFVIDTTGAIISDSVKINTGVFPSLDQEALRIIRESPDWIPGRVTVLNKNAKVRMVLPITFHLR